MDAVSHIVTEIAYRLGDPTGEKGFPRERILREINRLYRETNRAARVLSESIVFDTDTNPNNTIPVYTIKLESAGIDTDRNVSFYLNGVAFTNGVITIDNRNYQGNNASLNLFNDLLATIDADATMSLVSADEPTRTIVVTFIDYKSNIITYTDVVHTVGDPIVESVVATTPRVISKTFTVPERVIIPFYMDPMYTFFYKTAFRSQANSFTIIGKDFVFNFDENAFSPITLYFWSLGKKLVELVTDATTETAYPEYKNTDFGDLLIYGGASRLSTKYDLYKTDLVLFNEIKSELKKSEKIVQDVQPTTTQYRPARGTATRKRYGEDPWADTNK